MTAWSPARALLWEFGRLAWRPVTMVLLADCLLAALFHHTLTPLGAARDGIVFSSLLMTLLIVNIMALLTCRDDGLALGFEPRLFLLPLPTWMLVLGRLLPPLGTIAGMQLAVTLFVKQLYGMPWPVIDPTLLAMACLAWVTAILWSLGRWPFLLAPCGLVLAFLMQAWLRPRLGPQKLWPELSAIDTLTLMAAIVLATCVAVFGVAQARAQPRHINRLRILKAWSDSTTVGGTAAREAAVHEEAHGEYRGFGSAIRAQLWMEWREKGRLMTFSSLGGLAVHLALMSIPHPETTRLLQGAEFYLAFMVLIQPAIVGFLHGRTSLSSQVAELDRVRATRPLDDRHLAWTLLGAGARCLYSSWLVVLVGCAVVLLASSRWGNRVAVDAMFAALRTCSPQRPALTRSCWSWP